MMSKCRIFRCFNCIIFGAQSVGQTAAMSPDYTKAIEAGERILELWNRKPLIDNSSSSGEEIVSKQFVQIP